MLAITCLYESRLWVQQRQARRAARPAGWVARCC
jgi:hypothetical protein